MPPARWQWDGQMAGGFFKGEKMKSKCLPILLCLLLAFPLVCAGSPLDDFFKPPVLPGDTTTPFLKAFLVVYEDSEWVFVSNNIGPCAKIAIHSEPSSCNVNDTECCGSWAVSALDMEDTLAEGLFCLESTGGIILRDSARTWALKCVGMRGARMENPLHPDLGYALDDPVMIDCGSFRLVRPE